MGGDLVQPKKLGQIEWIGSICAQIAPSEVQQFWAVGAGPGDRFEWLDGKWNINQINTKVVNFYFYILYWENSVYIGKGCHFPSSKCLYPLVAAVNIL